VAPCLPATAVRKHRASAWQAAAVAFAFGCAPRLQTAELRGLTLANGEGVACRVTYRTFGRLDARRSNAVLVAPWFLGSSRKLAFQIGPGKLVDSSQYFVVAVDPISGDACGPSSTAPREPRITVHDLVEIQRRLVTDVLGLEHLKAVVGVSFGGMQVFDWTVSHPQFMDRAVAIAGTPGLLEPERRRWRAEAEAFRATPRWRRFTSALRTGALVTAYTEATVNDGTYALQADALIAQDLAARFGGSLQRAAANVRAPLLVVVSRNDPVLDPRPALEFARMAHASVLELDGRCGHSAPACERATLWPAVARFLEDGERR
jgi:homoserine O-acetyltransferase